MSRTYQLIKVRTNRSITHKKRPFDINCAIDQTSSIHYSLNVVGRVLELDMSVVTTLLERVDDCLGVVHALSSGRNNALGVLVAHVTRIGQPPKGGEQEIL